MSLNQCCSYCCFVSLLAEQHQTATKAMHVSYRLPPFCKSLNKICDIQKVSGSWFRIPLPQLPYSCWNSRMKLCMETLLRIFFFMEEQKMPDMLRIQIRTKRALIPYTCYQYGTHLKIAQYLPNLRVCPWEEGIKMQPWVKRGYTIRISHTNAEEIKFMVEMFSS